LAVEADFNELTADQDCRNRPSNN